MDDLIYKIEWVDPFISTPTKIVKTLPQQIDFTTPNAFIIISLVLIIGFVFWWFIYD